MLPDAALDALSADEQAAVLAHVSTCERCGPALAALRDATAQLAFAVPRAPDDPAGRVRVRTRLLARARADLAVADTNANADPRSGTPAADRPSAGGPRPPGDRIGRGAPGVSGMASPAAAWSVAALIGIAAVVGITMLEVRSTDEGQRVARSEATATARITQLQDSLAAHDSILSALSGSQTSMIRLASVVPGGAWAWMFWDHATNRWTLLAHGLPAIPTDKTYQLWLVTPRTRISAGLFTPQRDGSAELRATSTIARDSLRTIAVSEEPAGGVLQPTGPFVITATVGQGTPAVPR